MRSKVSTLSFKIEILKDLGGGDLFHKYKYVHTSYQRVQWDSLFRAGNGSFGLSKIIGLLYIATYFKSMG